MSPLKHSRNVAARMGRWSASHRKTAIFGWLAFVVAAFAIGMAIPMQKIDEADWNVGEARKGDHIIRDGGFALDEQSEFVLVQSDTRTVDDPAFQAVIGDAVATLRGFDQVEKLRSPLAAGNEGQISRDRHSALIQFSPEGSYDEAVTYIDSITAATEEVQSRNPDYYVGQAGSTSTGKALEEMFGSQLALAGLLSIPLTLGILLLVFGSVVGATIPLLLALTSVLATMGLVALPSQIVPMDESIAEVILLIGLAVGVDYSLFYIRRERDERRAGRSESAALEAAAATSGRAVLISGVTVMIAMAGMFFSGDKTFMSFAIGTMLVVAVAMVGSLTVLPAMLSWLGDRVDKVRVPLVWRLRRSDGEGRVWGAILDRVLRRPVLSVAAATAALVVLAVPALSLNPAISGLDALPASLEEIQSYNKVNDAFPGGALPAVVAISGDTSDPELQAAVAELQEQALATGRALEPIHVEVAPGGKAMQVQIPLVGKGTDAESNAALAMLREDVIPATLGTVSGIDYAVTGDTAASKDWNDAITASVPIVFGFVLAFAFLLLLATFRSIVIPAKAIAMNLLSVAAAYGVVVAVFQWGWGEGMLDFNSNGGVAAWLPMFLFVILFGLSMDYHVFILSRVREYYDRGLDTEHAVAKGIKSTAGVVTSAAVVMVLVFGVFALMPIIDMKEMGVGLAAAILIDATIVRAVLLPATMKLLGKWNWYLPTWLEWLPRLEHDRSPEPAPQPAS
ncbi:MAG TPA: MMPL family transporter [Gaiellaceae bacterium]|nr:MMPL family transporter [Gaiellaceae bacterium]